MALSGWIKLHRGLSDHHIASDPHALSVWVHLLLLANHAETKRLINGRVIVIKAGQILTSRKSLSAKTGVQESKIERILKMLKSEQQIEQSGTAKFRVISILNWDLHQSGEQPVEQQMNSKRTADEQQMNTPEEVQEGKECKDKIKNTCDQQAGSLVDDGFEAAWRAYPKREGANPKNKAHSCWKARLKDGVMVEHMLAGVARYAAYCAAKGSIGTGYVMQAMRFFGTERAFENDWSVSASSGKPSAHHGFDKIDYMAGVTGENEDGSFSF